MHCLTIFVHVYEYKTTKLCFFVCVGVEVIVGANAVLFIPVHTVVQCYPPLQQLHSDLLHSDLWDFGSGVCHVMKITIADSNPNMAVLT